MSSESRPSWRAWQSGCSRGQWWTGIWK
jgi:hypothetical protein